MTVSVGDEAPPFSACDAVDMTSVTSDAFAGKTVVLSFFPAAFSGSPEEGCEMQLCGMSSVAASAPADVAFYGVSCDLPFAAAAFAKKLSLQFPLLVDPLMKACAAYVGICPFGDFLKENGISDALSGVQTSNRGCVVIKNGKVVYAFSGEGHPGKMPPLKEIRAAIGL